MNTTRNLAKVFAMALRGAVQNLRGLAVLPRDDAERAICKTAYDSIDAIADELEGFAATPDPDGGG